MSGENSHTEQTIEVPSSSGHDAEPSLVAISGPLVTLTWVLFLVTAVLLYKVAWKPILKALDLREKSIRKALDNAAAAQADMERTEERRRQVMADTESRQREIIEEAKRSAGELATRLQQQAERETAALLADARRDIETATEQARRRLRAESADVAVDMAARLIGENMDAARHEALVERLAREM